MTLEHKTLKQRFLNGEALTQAEVMRLCRYEGDRWPLTLWQEERSLKGATA
jgi:hypothetical protein